VENLSGSRPGHFLILDEVNRFRDLVSRYLPPAVLDDPKQVNYGTSTMANYKQQTYKQMVMLPVSLEDQIVPGTLEFAIHTLVEDRMDLSQFDKKYQNDETGLRIQDEV